MAELTADDMDKIRAVTAECGGHARVEKESGEVVGILCYLPKSGTKEFRDQLAEIGYRASMRHRSMSANFCYSVDHELPPDPDSPEAIRARNAAATEHNLAVHEQAKRGVGRPLKGAKKRQKISVTLDPSDLDRLPPPHKKGDPPNTGRSAAIQEAVSDWLAKKGL